MPAKRPHKASVSTPWAYSSRLHVVMYSFLLVATPFLLLRNYLVNAIGALSMSRTDVFGVDIPVVPIVATALATVVLVALRRYVTGLRVIAVVFGLALIGLAQQITDFYFGHNFYDLQQNWHYIAYGIFAYMVHRDLIPRGIPRPKVMLWTYLAALGFSLFDELFQMAVSSRVFDMSDIGKDLWGALAGIIVLYLSTTTWRHLKKDWRAPLPKRLSSYLKRPSHTLILLVSFAFVFLCVSSLLSDPEHWPAVTFISLAIFAAVLVLLHLLAYRLTRRLVFALAVVALLAQGFFIVRMWDRGIVQQRYGLTVYRGIVIPFFDVMIYPDGGFRLVDKKHFFNYRDQDFFMKQEPDILLIGSGHDGLGGKGFLDETSQFRFNKYISRGTQVIILPTPDACDTYNRLKEEGKRVLFVLHSTC